MNFYVELQFCLSFLLRQQFQCSVMKTFKTRFIKIAVDVLQVGKPDESLLNVRDGIPWFKKMFGYFSEVGLTPAAFSLFVTYSVYVPLFGKLFFNI